MIRSLVIFSLTLFALQGFGQSEKSYRERALEIQHEIWNDSSSAFRTTEVPVGMSHESGVILATSFELNDTSKFTFKLGGPARKLSLQITERTRVKLNDLAAVEFYSKLEYLKNSNNSHVQMYDLYRNISETYIGVKIIRPGGSETIINTNDEVFKKSREKEGLLNIPGLKEGDILDYYVRNEKIVDVGSYFTTQGPYTFSLGNKDYQTLYQKLSFRFGEYFRPQYLSANGAPSLIKSKDGNDNTILQLTLTNLPRLQDIFWISELRQIPFIRFQLLFLQKGETLPGLFNGEVTSGSLYSIYVDKINEFLQNPKVRYDNHPLTITKDYFGGPDKMKNIPRDSIAKVLFNAWYYYIFISQLKDTVKLLDGTKYAKAAKLTAALEMSKMLSSINIDNTLYLVCSRNTASFKNVMNFSDIDALIKVSIDNSHNYWMAFDDIVTVFNEIPARFQDEFAISMKPGSKTGSNEGNYEKDKIPLTIASDNTITDSIQVNFDSSNLLILRIGQSSRVTGSPRHDVQKNLMLFEDIESALAASVSQKTIVDRLKSGKTKEEFQAAFDRERRDQKTYFASEINARFGNMPIDVLNYEVINPALCREDPVFGYRKLFTMNNWVTNESGAYRMKAGKLLGVYQDFANPDHARSLNIYLPSARTFTCDISIHIPSGYKVKDADNLNILISNETGSCKSTATMTTNTLAWHVSETFTNNFEPALNWSKLAEVMNAMYVLSGKEIILEKNKP